MTGPCDGVGRYGNKISRKEELHEPVENLLLCKKGVGHVIVIESFGVDLETSPGSGAGLLGLRREIVQDEADKASRLGKLGSGKKWSLVGVLTR